MARTKVKEVAPVVKETTELEKLLVLHTELLARGITSISKLEVLISQLSNQQ